jgi:PRTRC genetic system protein B
MRNITNNISDFYAPYKALLIHKSIKQLDGHEEGDTATQVYVESYDISKHGNPINAHPLSQKESFALADMLQATREMQNNYLRSSSLLPNNLLYVNPDNNGYAIWFTPGQQKELYFIPTLGIKSGLAHIPSLVWVASREELQVFAIKGNKKPKANTQLYHPPFFNTYSDGRVCMGTVNIQIDHTTRLEDFMQKWEQYFYNSYFSHTLQGGSILNGNIVQLWKQQTETSEKFPESCLVKNGESIQNLIK